MGALPYLVNKLGCTAQIYATLPVWTLGRLFFEEVFHAHATCQEDRIKAFDEDDVDAVFDRIIRLEYGRVMQINTPPPTLDNAGMNTMSTAAQPVFITPHAAGHLLGGAFWEISKDPERILYAIEFNHTRERHLAAGVVEGPATQRPTLLITDAYNVFKPTIKRLTRDFVLMDSIETTLKVGGDVLLPVDIAGRCFELLLLLSLMWPKNNITAPLVFYSPEAKTAVDLARGLTEWMSREINAQVHEKGINPLDLPNIQLVQTPSELAAIPRPRVVVATGQSLLPGTPAHEVFTTQIVNSPHSSVIFTTETMESGETDDVRLNSGENSAGTGALAPALLRIARDRELEFLEKGIQPPPGPSGPPANAPPTKQPFPSAATATYANGAPGVLILGSAQGRHDTIRITTKEAVPVGSGEDAEPAEAEFEGETHAALSPEDRMTAVGEAKHDESGAAQKRSESQRSDASSSQKSMTKPQPRARRGSTQTKRRGPGSLADSAEGDIFSFDPIESLAKAQQPGAELVAFGETSVTAVNNESSAVAANDDEEAPGAMASIESFTNAAQASSSGKTTASEADLLSDPAVASHPEVSALISRTAALNPVPLGGGLFSPTPGPEGWWSGTRTIAIPPPTAGGRPKLVPTTFFHRETKRSFDSYGELLDVEVLKRVAWRAGGDIGAELQNRFQFEEEMKLTYGDLQHTAAAALLAQAAPAPSTMPGQLTQHVSRASATRAAMASAESATGPLKLVWHESVVEVLCRVVYVDIEGRSDGRSIKMVIERMMPKKVVIIHGLSDAKEDLRAFCESRKISPVYVPSRNENTEIGSDSHVYRVMLHESLSKTLRFVEVGGMHVAYADAQISMEVENGVPRPVLVPVPPVLSTGHPAVLLGDFKFPDLKRILNQNGIPADFQETVLVCGKEGQVHVRKLDDTRISIQGVLCEELYRIRALLYGQYHVV